MIFFFFLFLFWFLYYGFWFVFYVIGLVFLDFSFKMKVGYNNFNCISWVYFYFFLRWWNDLFKVKECYVMKKGLERRF